MVQPLHRDAFLKSYQYGILHLAHSSMNSSDLHGKSLMLKWMAINSKSDPTADNLQDPHLELFPGQFIMRISHHT